MLKCDDLKMFAAELRSDLPTLDLHGTRPSDVPEKIDLFLYEQHQKKEGAAQIIYGGGKGVLRKAVLDFLSSHPLVDKMLEMGGYCLVVLTEGGRN